MKIIPISIMRELSNVQSLFDAYCNSKMVSEDVVPFTDLLFHPTIDCQRFMEASMPVMHYIKQNKILFKAVHCPFNTEC